MNSFEYAAPKTLAEAIGLLAPAWGETEVLAGGTDLITSLKQQIVAPKRVVSLKQIPELRGIDANMERIRIAGATPLVDVLAHADIAKEFPSITAPIEGIRSRQIIARGTIAGDLCQRPRCWYFRNGFGLLAQHDGQPLVPNGENRYHAIFGNEGPVYFVSPSRLGPSLVVLGATVVIQGPNGERTVPCAEFFKVPASEGEREYALQSNEIVTYIDVPRKGLKNAAYEIQQRQGLDWPYVAAAVAYRAEASNAAEPVVVLGHVAPTPWISKPAADAINGKAVDETTAAACGEAAAQGAKPLSQNGYKVRQVKAAVKRALMATVTEVA